MHCSQRIVCQNKNKSTITIQDNEENDYLLGCRESSSAQRGCASVLSTQWDSQSRCTTQKGRLSRQSIRCNGKISPLATFAISLKTSRPALQHLEKVGGTETLSECCVSV